MKKIFFVFGVLSAGLFFGQSQKQNTVFVVDGNLSNSNFAEKLATDKTSSTTIYQKQSFVKFFPFLVNTNYDSVWSVTTKEKNYDRISLAELNDQFGIAKNNPVYFDGNLFTDTSLKITGDSLKEMTATEKDGKKYLFIYSEAQK